MKDKVAFFEASKNPIPKRRNLLAKFPFLQAKRALFKTPFRLDRVSFSTPAFGVTLKFRCFFSLSCCFQHTMPCVEHVSTPLSTSFLPKNSPHHRQDMQSTIRPFRLAPCCKCGKNWAGPGCLKEGCLGPPGVLPDIFGTAIFPRK